MKISTLIVDDEAPARVRLRRLLAPESDIEIVGEAASGEDAILAIGRLHPALLFLDVQMPAPNGLAVLRAVRDEWLPCTIFTTAYAEHAVAAFELHALDYLLKPYSRERFAAALARARQHLLATGPAAGDARVAALLAGQTIENAPVERFLVKNRERYLVVRAADIEWVEAAANYVVLHTAAGNHVLRRTLAAVEADVDPRRFFRLSRSSLVNLATIREVQALAAGEHVVILRSGARLTLTRGLRELQERLKSLS
ncbi:MAG: LytTR family DNA-binding domain-containing protein [Opitutaceae bacterium]|nr:LytTR family DNA-binding domain-containing protein [Opitutaceae bacterium]